MKVLTEADLRRMHLKENKKEWILSKDVFVTPTAREYAKEQGIRLEIEGEKYKEMSQTPIRKNLNGTFVDAMTGIGYSDKPEEMTHLRGNLLISKTDPRITLRGKLDSLQAKVLLLESEFLNNKKLFDDLESVLQFLQKILAAEVKNEPVEALLLFGLTEEEIHNMSHNVNEAFGIRHMVPNVEMGRLALQLNELRTQVRETELKAAVAFQEGDILQVIKRLNRLSSGIYVLFCRTITGYYDGKEGEEK